MLSIVLFLTGIETAFANSETTNAELQDKLGNEIHEIERANEAYSKLEPNTEVQQLIADNEAKIESLEKKYYELSPKRQLADISEERRNELTLNMWKLASTDYPFLSMGINSYTGEINIMLDESKISNIDQELQRIVGENIQLNITYGQDDAEFQGSCPNQTGKCTTIIGASKGEPDNVNDIIVLSILWQQKVLAVLKSMV